MAIVHPPESAYAKEMVKWEAYPTQMGPGLRPYVKREYPMMIFKAGRSSDGVIGIEETRIVESDIEAANHFSRGFYATPNEAYDGLKADDLEIAKIAANRNYQELRMSRKARAESAAVEAITSGHLANIPETPIKRRGRPRKAKAASEPVS